MNQHTMEEFGIFIHAKKDDTDFRRACLKELSTLVPARNICYMSREEKYNGFIVYLDDAETVSRVLKVKNLNVRGECYPMYPITTLLIVHARPSDLNEEFESLIRDSLTPMGPVLEVKKVPFSDDFPDIFSGDWKVVLGVPEIEDLNVFAQKGLPDNMLLKLPGLTNEYRVTFRCSFCGKDDHTLHGCPKAIPELRIDAMLGSKGITRMSSTLATSENSDGNEDKPVRAPESRKRSRPSKSIKSMAKLIGEETVMQRLSSDPWIKQECNLDSMESCSTKRFSEQPKNISKVKRKCGTPPFVQMSFSNEDDDDDSPFHAPYQSPEDVLNQSGSVRETTNNLNSNISSSNSIAISESGLQDEPSQVTTSSLVGGMEETNESIKSEPLSDDDDETRQQSHDRRHAVVTRRRTPTQSRQIIIPEGIRDIIRRNQEVLSEHQLEAFFNHVKKKACPSLVARQYTQEIQGLKAQLQRIKDDYYGTPIIHTADEKYFMKWFANVLDRFDRMPTQRVRKNPLKD